MDAADDPVAARERRRAAYRARERARISRAFDNYLRDVYGEATDMHRESETHGDYGVSGQGPVCACATCPVHGAEVRNNWEPIDIEIASHGDPVRTFMRPDGTTYTVPWGDA